MNFNKVDWVGLPESEYYRTVHPKKQIVLHHTASGRGADGDIRWWLTDPKRIATCIIIDYEGRYKQLFNTRYWAHHLGMWNMHNAARNRESIAIEIDSWGPLVKRNNRFYSYTGTEVEANRVAVYDKGFRTYPNAPVFKSAGVVGEPVTYYERYTRDQLLSLKELLIYLNEKYEIPLTYHPGMWDYNENAVKGHPGVWTHVSYRRDKLDCHPQPELINLLRSL